MSCWLFLSLFVLLTTALPNPTVELQTSLGTITLELFPSKAPVTVANFLQYVDEGFYDGTIFHRVALDFVIQGGAYTPDLQQKPTRPGIKNEWNNGLSHEVGTLAMARLTGKADSATSQFFINTHNNSKLNEPHDGSGYAIFGRVIGGYDVVTKIEHVPVGVKNEMTSVPITPVVVTHAKWTYLCNGTVCCDDQKIHCAVAGQCTTGPFTDCVTCAPGHYPGGRQGTDFYCIPCSKQEHCLHETTDHSGECVDYKLPCKECVDSYVPDSEGICTASIELWQILSTIAIIFTLLLAVGIIVYNFWYKNKWLKYNNEPIEDLKDLSISKSTTSDESYSHSS